MRRWFKSRSQSDPVGLLLGRDRLWLACAEPAPLFASLPCAGPQEWSSAIPALLAQHAPGQRKVHLVLCSEHYQQAQIDKPAVPDGELAGALPWAIKDFVTEPVMQLSLDYVDLPTPPAGRPRINVIAVAKSRVQQLADAVNQVARLESITTDELSLTALFEEDGAVRLLLWQPAGQELQLLVFHRGGLCFSRVLRGFKGLASAPLEPLELDSLTLEIQRSLDYLQGQLKLPECATLQLALTSPGLGALVGHLEQSFGFAVSAMANKAILNGIDYLPAYAVARGAGA
ncbi:MSHA biogenesis protein MshI [Aeromonas schubertii]|uniref:hypothetical protein n=1 Tax=Aeromonas schubertii TaxID=652 RepID=UPI00067F3B3B|nr:hypothetical protein [Aeromonas schubertii]KUE80682.1 MSHA biogenesis protein MshI [Aeromonas schubertii]